MKGSLLRCFGMATSIHASIHAAGDSIFVLFLSDRILAQQSWVLFAEQIYLLVELEYMLWNLYYFILMKLFQMGKLLINANVHSHLWGRILQTCVQTSEPLLIFTSEMISFSYLLFCTSTVTCQLPAINIFLYKMLLELFCLCVTLTFTISNNCF